MKLKNEILLVVKEIRNNKEHYLFLFFQLVFFSGLIRQLTTDEALVANIIVTAFLCLKAGKITRRVNNVVLGFLGIFIFINIIPTLMFGISPELFLGYLGRIFLGILIVAYFKGNFFSLFEKLVFVLAAISLPLFLIQIIYVQFFDLFRGLSNLMLTDERLLFGRGDLSGHRYLIVFLVNSWAEYRNSGFMWEPAAFGAIISWAMLFNIVIYRFTVNPRLILLFFAAVSTFSVGTYIYLFIFITLFLSKSFGNRNLFFFLLLIFALLYGSFRIDFVKNNFDMITEKIETEKTLAAQIEAGMAHERVSRVGGFLGNFQQIVSEPFGFGTRENILTEHSLYETPNGFMILLRNWGIFSLMILLCCSQKLIKKLSTLHGLKLSFYYTALLMLIIILPIAGNPFYNQPFLYAILLSGFVTHPKFIK